MIDFDNLIFQKSWIEAGTESKPDRRAIEESPRWTHEDATAALGIDEPISVKSLLGSRGPAIATRPLKIPSALRIHRMRCDPPPRILSPRPFIAANLGNTIRNPR